MLWHARSVFTALAGVVALCKHLNPALRIVASALVRTCNSMKLAAPAALGGFVLRHTFSVPPDAPLAEFIAAARSHPVFEIISPGAM